MKMPEGERLKMLTSIESEYWSKGQFVAGTDEAGRGPLAGPVCAACVIMPQTPLLERINDSKKVTPKNRAILFEQIKATAIAYSIAFVDNETIDKINIKQATLLAMRKAYSSLKTKPDVLLTDYESGVARDIDERPIVHGDAISYTIAAASILAKEARDRLMRDMDAKYPGFDFASNKGYGSTKHFEAIRALGASPIHRTSFLKKLTQSASQAGRVGEDAALAYLLAKGYALLCRNYFAYSKEIDLVMRDGDTTVFVEVKARSASSYERGRDALTAKKRSNLTVAANAYAREHNCMNERMRFDVVEVDLTTNSVTHFINAFEALGQ